MPRAYKRRNSGDIIGVGEAVLVKRIDNRLWEMQCKCGEHYVGQPSESKGFCRACAYNYVGEKVAKHRESPDVGKKATRLYRIWVNMRARCRNKNHPDYARYGGRGIGICVEWEDYNTFKAWAMSNGYKENLSIDRTDNDGNYCPENCRWADQRTQIQNTSQTIRVNGVSLKKWCEEHNLNYEVIKHYRQKHPEKSIEDILKRYTK